MAQIRITKINAGAKGTTCYNGKYYHTLDYEYAKEIGLLKYSAWLYTIEEGETVIVPYKMLDEIREAAKGTFEFELEHPKYANHHVGSDVNPYEVVEWISDTKVRLRRMETDEYCGTMGEYCEKYISNPNNPTFVVREHKNGYLYDVGTRHCPYILSDKPYYFRDPCF